MIVARQLSELREASRCWTAAGETIGLVPTMGALHSGHLTLVARARAECTKTMVSIFVNPTQFGPNEDFSAYPRVEAKDIASLEGAGVDLVWLPDAATMYPPGFATSVNVAGITQELCGPIRPGHFQGVATVVTKLLLQSGALRAYFGEKDYQQLLVIRRLVQDLDIPAEIVGVPTVREPDGLALSSRNLYLDAAAREAAAALPLILRETAARALADSVDLAKLLDSARQRLLAAGFSSIDYLTIADAETLRPVTGLARPARIFVAARIGKTRLIDNMPVGP